MKIAVDIRTAGGEKAGKGWFTFHIVQNLLQIDTDNEYILYAREGVPGFEQFKNARLKLINSKGFFWHRKVLSDIKKEQIDIFFAPSSYIIPALLPRYIKCILTVHDLVAFLFPNTHNKKAVFLERLLLKKALKKATHVIAVSENTKSDIIKKFKTEKEKISVIYCAAGEEFKPIKKENLKNFAAKTNLPEKFFLSVGTLEPRKNYVNLIKGFAQIAEKFQNYHLIIVGKEGWDYQPIYEEIEQNQLNNKVHILGYLSNTSLINLYNLAKALIFPSMYEGFGLPPLEAMKCGCPVIASYSSSIPEVVNDSALMIDPENPIEIAGAITKLITDEELCEKLRNQGLIQAHKFSWEQSAKKLLEAIEA